MQQRLQTTPERNASIKVKHLINNCKPGRKMLRGLPLSKELGRWSGHSGSSSTSSPSASGTSCCCTSNCSSDSSGMTTGFSVCDPVWCNVRKWLCKRCIEWDGCNGYVKMQGSQHHPRNYTTSTCHLLHSLLLLICYVNISYEMLQRYTKALLIS